MIGYPFQTWSRSLISWALGIFMGAILLSLLCVVVRPLLPAILGITTFVVVLALWLRWLLFRLRGW